jgi:hypothetical protein
MQAIHDYQKLLYANMTVEQRHAKRNREKTRCVIWQNTPSKKIYRRGESFAWFIRFWLMKQFLDNIWQHIRCKPTSPWKLWKLQSEPHDVDPTERLEEEGGVICKSTFANHPPHLLWICKSPTSHEFSLGSKSCGLDWRFHSLQKRLVSTRYVPIIWGCLDTGDYN